MGSRFPVGDRDHSFPLLAVYNLYIHVWSTGKVTVCLYKFKSRGIGSWAPLNVYNSGSGFPAGDRDHSFTLLADDKLYEYCMSAG